MIKDKEKSQCRKDRNRAHRSQPWIYFDLERGDDGKLADRKKVIVKWSDNTK